MDIKSSLCKYPITTLFIDDNESYLESMSASILIPGALVTYTRPNDLLAHLAQQKNNTFAQFCMDQEFDDPEQHNAILLNRVQDRAEDSNRFDEVGVIIVDYAMPSMTGVELSQKIKAEFPALKIIMLTGEADESIAINAFNQGVIDMFLMKSSLNNVLEVESAIAQMTQAYFMIESKKVYGNLIIEANVNPPHALALNELESVLAEQIKGELREFYLCADVGNFKVVGQDQKPVVVVIRSEAEMAEESEFVEASLTDDDSSEALLAQVKAKEAIPVFITDEDYNLGIEDWSPLMTSVGEQDIAGQKFWVVHKVL